MSDLLDDETLIIRRLNTLDSRLAKLVSDTNDIKTTQVVDHRDIQVVCREITTMRKVLFGNGEGGIVAQIRRNSEHIDTIEDYQREHSKNVEIKFDKILSSVTNNLAEVRRQWKEDKEEDKKDREKDEKSLRETFLNWPWIVDKILVAVIVWGIISFLGG